MKKLYWVQCRVGVDAESRRNAAKLVSELYQANTKKGFNFLIYNADLDLNYRKLSEFRIAKKGGKN